MDAGKEEEEECVSARDGRTPTRRPMLAERTRGGTGHVAASDASTRSLMSYCQCLEGRVLLPVAGRPCATAGGWKAVCYCRWLEGRVLLPVAGRPCATTGGSKTVRDEGAVIRVDGSVKTKTEGRMLGCPSPDHVWAIGGPVCVWWVCMRVCQRRLLCASGVCLLLSAVEFAVGKLVWHTSQVHGVHMA